MDTPFVITLLVTCVAFTGIWLINVRIKDAGIIDYYWGPGFFVIGAITLVMAGAVSWMQWVLLLAVFVWSARLAIHLGIRHQGSQTEDGRYLAMREAGGPGFWWSSLPKIFLLQAVIMWLVALPLHMSMAVQSIESANIGLFWLGLLIFALGFAIEWIADQQLSEGKRKIEPSALYSGGLWGYSRHPNYVGEITLWWGLGLSAYAISGALVGFLGPALLTLVMLAVSVPLTDQHLRATRKGYASYANRVPRLVPISRQPRDKAQKQPAE